jgi:hypothetical protein
MMMMMMMRLEVMWKGEGIMNFGLEVRQIKCVGVESELVCLFKGIDGALRGGTELVLLKGGVTSDNL